MTLVSIKSGSGEDLKRIELSDGSLFSFKTCYVSPVFFDDTHYVPGIGISADEAEAFRFAAACLRTEKAALGLVARAEQCVFGLSRKLERGGHPAASVRAVLARLTELEIVDDSRFARLWVQSRLNRRTDTPRKLLAGLCSRGIDRDVAEKALKTGLHFEAEKTLLYHYIEKNRLFEPQPESSPEDRAENTLPGGQKCKGNGWQCSADLVSLKFKLKSEGFSPAVIQYFWEENN
jgi:regulatory protein